MRTLERARKQVDQMTTRLARANEIAIQYTGTPQYAWALEDVTAAESDLQAALLNYPMDRCSNPNCDETYPAGKGSDEDEQAS